MRYIINNKAKIKATYKFYKIYLVLFYKIKVKKYIDNKSSFVNKDDLYMLIGLVKFYDIFIYDNNKSKCAVRNDSIIYINKLNKYIIRLIIKTSYIEVYIENINKNKIYVYEINDDSRINLNDIKLRLTNIIVKDLVRNLIKKYYLSDLFM